MKNIELPKTTGKWAPIIRGKETVNEHTVAYLEVFDAGNGRWCSVPGSSRVIEVVR